MIVFLNKVNLIGLADIAKYFYLKGRYYNQYNL